MSEEEWVPLRSVEAFRRYKRRAAGVIVIRGSASTMVHHPDCPHVSEDSFATKLANGRGGYFWATSVAVARARWSSARTCQHPSDPLVGGAGGPEARARAVARTEPRSADTWSVQGPGPQLRGVRGEADFILPFEPRSSDQVAFRTELRERLRRLALRDDEILHAMFFGVPPARADVENLLIYNVDQSGRSFRHATGGVRFELSSRPAPNATRPNTYIYRPVVRRATLSSWHAGQAIASWSEVTLTDPRDRAGVWLAFRRMRDPAWSEIHSGPFTVAVAIRGPRGGPATAPVSLVKPLLDGIVSSLQAHADSTTLSAVSHRMARVVDARAAEIAQLLQDSSGAALGTVPRLVHMRGDGVQLAPGDDRCVGAEVLLTTSDDDTPWRASCRVLAAQPR
jgi:hypothetical protein